MPVTNKIVNNLLLAFLLVGVLYFTRSFLVPVVFAFMLAMLLIPVCNWAEKRGVKRGVAAATCVLLFVLAVTAVFVLLSWQVAGIAEDAVMMIGKVNNIPTQARQYIERTLGFSIEQQIIFIKEQTPGITLKAGDKIAVAAGSAFALLGHSLLVVIYSFLFIFYSEHLGRFVLQVVAVKDKEVAEKIMESSTQVAQKYISGLGIMICVLWVLYGIGFSVIGIKHALFFAMLCGLLEIVPYAGNLTGSLITAAMAFTQGGSAMALWVLLVYAIVQFTQTYFLEPLIVGAKVSINPLFTIVAIIAGDMLWGIPGMVLAIPMLGIVKIVCDNIPTLRPYGFLIGEVRTRKSK